MKPLLISLALALTMAAPIAAHEGHHKILGTISAVRDTQLDVKATTGRTETITIDGKTKLKKGSTGVKVSDLEVGDRVVVTALSTKGSDGKPRLVAEEVLLGVAKTEAKK
jgi:hypothetical protein